MFIQPDKPFQITRGADGSQHAVKESIQVTVTPDCGETKVHHRNGTKPATGESSRWLHVNLKDKGLHVFISGTHVVITERDYLPTFDMPTPDRLLEEALKRMKADKDEKGRYVVDTISNRKVLRDLFEMVRDGEKNRLLQSVKNVIARLCE